MSDGPNRIPVWLRALGITLFLVGFPLLVGEAALQFFLGLQTERHARETNRMLTQSLVRLEPFSDTQRVLRIFLKRLMQRFDDHRLSPEAILQTLSRICRRHPRLFRFTLFDAQDRAIQAIGGRGQRLPVTGKALGEKFLATIRQWFLVKTDPWTQEERNRFATYLGANRGHNLDALKDSRGWIPLSVQDRRTWFFLHLGERFSLYAHVHRLGYPPMAALKRQLSRLSHGQAKVFLVDAQDRRVLAPAPGPLTSEMESTLAQYDRSPLTTFRTGEEFWAVLFLDSRLRLLASVPDPDRVQREGAARAYRLLALISFLAGFWVTRGVLSSTSLPYVSIRWKLWTLFGLAAALPFLMLGLTGFLYLQEREQALVQEAWNRAMELVQNVDRKFPISTRSVEADFEKVLAHTQALGGPAGERFSLALATFQQKHRFTDMKIADPTGDSPLARLRLKPKDRALKSFMLRTLLNLSGSLDPRATQELERITSAFEPLAGQEMVRFFDTGISQLGRVVQLHLGERRLALLQNVVRNGSGAVTHVVLAVWKRVEAIRWYLQRALPFKPFEDGTELVVLFTGETIPKFTPVWKAGSRRLTFRENWNLVPRRAYAAQLVPFLRELRQNRRPMTGFLETGNQTLLLAGSPGLAIDEAVFLAATPFAPIRSQIRVLRLKLLGIASCSLAFLGVLWSFLTRKVIGPVQDLAGGIRAIQEKRYQHRIPVPDPDELGDTVRLFNEMMGSLLEVTLAEQVQTRLIPSARLTSGTVSVFGRQITVSELGGDYFDYFLLPDGRLVVVVGDVTGHGIPAALIMAMCKSLFSGLVPRGTPLEEVLSCFNAVLLSTMKKELFMTLAVIEIRVGDGMVRYFNCGHPYLFKWSPNHGIGEIPASGTPLGFRAKITFKPVETTLFPGERLILYTDGLPEGILPLEDLATQDGFLAFQSFLLPRLTLPLEEACDRVLSDHRKILGAAPADDLTIVMVERCGQKEDCGS